MPWCLVATPLSLRARSRGARSLRLPRAGGARWKRAARPVSAPPRPALGRSGAPALSRWGRRSPLDPQDSEGVYFISSGSVSIYQGEEMLTTLGPNSILGEMALLHPEGRAVASVRVDSSLEGYHLSKESYTALESSYPQIRDYIESIARLRLKQRATAIKSPVAIGPDASVEKMFSELHLGESRHDQLRRELRAKREVRQVEAVRGGSSMHSRFDKRQVSEAAGSRFDRKQPSFVQKKPVKTAGLQSVKGGKGWGILRQNTMARAQNDSKSVLGLAGQAGSARGACSTNGEGRLSRAAV